MSQFDPDFRFFNAASGYRNCFTDHEAKFSAFKDYVCNGTKSTTNFADSFVIQFVCHPNFAAHIKTITYYTFNTDSGEFTEICSLPGGYKRATPSRTTRAVLLAMQKDYFTKLICIHQMGAALTTLVLSVAVPTLANRNTTKVME